MNEKDYNEKDYNEEEDLKAIQEKNSTCYKQLTPEELRKGIWVSVDLFLKFLECKRSAQERKKGSTELYVAGCEPLS